MSIYPCIYWYVDLHIYGCKSRAPTKDFSAFSFLRGNSLQILCIASMYGTAVLIFELSNLTCHLMPALRFFN